MCPWLEGAEACWVMLERKEGVAWSEFLLLWDAVGLQRMSVPLLLWTWNVYVFRDIFSPFPFCILLSALGGWAVWINCRPTFEANVEVGLAKVRGYSTGTIQKNLGEWGQWNYSLRSVLIRLQWTMWSSWAKSSQRSCLSRWLSYLWCWSTTSCLLLVPGWFRYILPCSRLWSYFLFVSRYSNHTDRHLTGPCLINFTF